MESNLHGIYKISFNIHVDSSDQLDTSDITQALIEGFGEELLERVSNLNVESIEKYGKKESKSLLKIGDLVQLKENIKIKANIYSDDGYLFTGKPTEISEIESEDCIISVVAGNIGYINKIHDNKIEIIDLDKPISFGNVFVNVDAITVNAEQLEKIEIMEDK